MPAKMRTAQNDKYFILLASLIFSFILVEIGLRQFTSETLFLDPKTDAYWQAALREKINNEPVLPAELADTIYDPKLGWRMTPFFNENGEIHNSQGFRGGEEFTDDNADFRIMAVGDSFTYGLGVVDSDAYISQLGEQLDVQAVNAGVNAYGIDQAFLMWQEEGVELAPDVVILGYFVDDFFRNGLSIRDRPKPYFRYDEQTQTFDLAGAPVNDIDSEELALTLEKSGGLRIVQALSWLKNKIGRAFGMYDLAALSERGEISAYILEQINNSVSENGGRLIIIFIGHCFDGIPENEWIEESVLESCDKYGIQCINMAEKMRQAEFNTFYDSNCHWSEDGHAFAAAELASFIQTEIAGQAPTRVQGNTPLP